MNKKWKFKFLFFFEIGIFSGKIRKSKGLSDGKLPKNNYAGYSLKEVHRCLLKKFCEIKVFGNIVTKTYTEIHSAD